MITLLIIVAVLALLPAAFATVVTLMGGIAVVMSEGRWKWILGVPAAALALIVFLSVQNANNTTVATSQPQNTMSPRESCLALTYDQAGIDRCNTTTPQPN